MEQLLAHLALEIAEKRLQLAQLTADLQGAQQRIAELEAVLAETQAATSGSHP